MTPEELQEKTLVAMKPFATIFLDGLIKRPVNDELGVYLACGWCGEKAEYRKTTPDGWVFVGMNYCCPACSPNVLPEHFDE